MKKYEYYLTYDYPIPYKDLKIYPVTMRNYYEFNTYVSCFLLDKNSVPDVLVISMSYLEYLYYVSQQEDGAPFLYYFKMLMYLVLHLEEEDQMSFKMEDGKPYFYVNDKKFNSSDFEQIRDIICLQNDVQQIDYTIQKEVRDAMEKAREYKARQDGNKPCSLEDKFLCASIGSNYKKEELYDLTIRAFNRLIERIDHKLHYEIYLSAQMSGMVTFKESPKHWMVDLTEEDSYKDVKMDAEELHQKVDEINR